LADEAEPVDLQLFEMQMADPMSEEVLDANSDDVMDALFESRRLSGTCPVVAVNMHTCSIKLRFQVIARTDAEIHKRLAKIIAVIEREALSGVTRGSRRPPSPAGPRRLTATIT
jgi:hypothetical protein